MLPDEVNDRTAGRFRPNAGPRNRPRRPRVIAVLPNRTGRSRSRSNAVPPNRTTGPSSSPIPSALEQIGSGPNNIPGSSNNLQSGSSAAPNPLQPTAVLPNMTVGPSTIPTSFSANSSQGVQPGPNNNIPGSSNSLHNIQFGTYQRDQNPSQPTPIPPFVIAGRSFSAANSEGKQSGPYNTTPGSSTGRPAMPALPPNMVSVPSSVANNFKAAEDDSSQAQAAENDSSQAQAAEDDAS